MSAWGISNFENDSALGFVSDLIEAENVDSIDGLIKDFVKSFDPEDTSLIDCSRFLAVAEVLAGLLGSPSADFPDEMTDWIETKRDWMVLGSRDAGLVLNGSDNF